jgi:hypothetical protein
MDAFRGRCLSVPSRNVPDDMQRERIQFLGLGSSPAISPLAER